MNARDLFSKDERWALPPSPSLVPGMPAARTVSPVPPQRGCGFVMCSQPFPVIVFLLGRGGRRERVFVDQLMLKFDGDLLVCDGVIYCKKCRRWMCVCGRSWGLIINEIKNAERPSWSCVIWGCLPGSMEQTALILGDVSLSLK